MVKNKTDDNDYELNDGSVEDWVEKSYKSNKLVEEWERGIVEETTATN